MALRKESGEIPQGAVRLTEDDAVIHQWKIISSWDSVSDVWPLKYGTHVIIASTALSALCINNFYRKMLKLGRHGRVATYLPTVVIPALAATLFHQQGVLSDILIMKSECPVCVQIRSGSFQAVFGGLYPALLSPLAGFMLATRHYTYDIPAITVIPRETFNLWLKLTRRIKGFLLASICGQALLGSGLAFLQMKSIISVNKKMISLENSGAPLDL